MLRIENHCCGCAVPGYPCLGRNCPNREAEVHYCDRCGEELERVHEFKGEELCSSCYEEAEESEDAENEEEE